jgi:hypothetical protein
MDPTAEPLNLCDTQLMSRRVPGAGKRHAAHRDSIFFRSRTVKAVGRNLILLCALTSAMCGGSTTTATPVTPGGVATFTLSPPSLAFPATAVGTAWAFPGVVTLSSGGSAALSVSSITDSDSGDFPETTTCPTSGSLALAAACTISVQFQPGTPGNLSAQLTISTNVGTQTLALLGVATGAPPQLAVTPTSYSFPTTAIGQQVSTGLTVSAIGAASLLLTGISSSNPTEFSLVGFTCPNPGSGQALAGGTSCGLQFGFRPIAPGPRSAQITVTSNGGTGTVFLSGTGE